MDDATKVIYRKLSGEQRSVNAPLRIALIHVADKGGGAERSVLTLHQSLLAQGHISRLFVGSKQLQEPGVIEIARQRSIPGVLRLTNRLEQRGIQNLYAPWFRNLADAIGEADVVHMHSLWKARNSFADLSGIQTIAARYPTVMTLRDGWMLTGHCACPIGCDRWKTGCGQCPDLNRPPAIQKDYTRLNWNRKRKTIQSSRLHITAVSSWLKDQIEQSPIFAGKPVHVVHNSVDADGFQPGDSITARRALGVPENKFVVLLAGQSIEGFHQGISQHAIQAINQLNDTDIHTMLIGRSAADVAATLKTPATIIPFRDTQQEMAQCYHAADLTIVPSEYETFGRVAAESLYCGTPVLAFDTGGLSDIVADGVCGKLVATGDVDGLAAAIADFKAFPHKLAEMGSTCVPHAQDRFNTERIAQEYVHVYRKVIAERNPGEPAINNNRTANTEKLSKHTITNGQANGHGSRITSDATVRVSEPTKISCVVPAWNCEPWLKRAVESLVATNYRPLEIIIVDDGSTDGTFELATRLAHQYPGTVHVLQHPEAANKGVSASRNLGLAHCTGEWISFLDADDYVYPDRYKSAAQILASRPDVDAVHQIAEMVFPTEETGNRWWKDSPYFGFQESIAANDLLSHLLTGKCWATSAIVFRKSLLQRSGVFHEQLKVAEDCHLWFRMASVGCVASGDLSYPVSAYWRRLDSAYQPSPSQRLSMIRAMTSYLAWLQNADVSPNVRRNASKAVGQYVLNGLTNARFDKQRSLAWSIAWQGVRGLPSISIDPEFFGQVVRLAAGR
jgi:glycosyltransferase involved in cell wall biosynthesis